MQLLLHFFKCNILHYVLVCANKIKNRFKKVNFCVQKKCKIHKIVLSAI